MKTILLSALIFLSIPSFAQNTSTKKSAILELISIECEDYCYLQMIDIKTKKKYDIESIDVKTQNWDMIQKNNYNQNQLNGKNFKVDLEFRHPQYWGDKKPRMNEKKWMFNKLTLL